MMMIKFLTSRLPDSRISDLGTISSFLSVVTDNVYKGMLNRHQILIAEVKQFLPNSPRLELTSRL